MINYVFDTRGNGNGRTVPTVTGDYQNRVTDYTAIVVRVGFEQRKRIAYGFSSMASNSMKSKNPHSGIYVAETTRTLDENCCLPSCNQGGIAVVEISDSNNRVGGYQRR